MDEDDARVVRLVDRDVAERDLREVDGAEGHALIDVAGQRGGDFSADGGLGFFGGAADVRGEDDVAELAELRDEGGEGGVEVVAVAAGFGRVDVEGGAGDVRGLHGGDEGGDVDDRPARRVEEVGAFFHEGELRGGNEVRGVGGFGDVAGDEVSSAEEGGEVGDLAGGAE